MVKLFGLKAEEILSNLEVLKLFFYWKQMYWCKSCTSQFVSLFSSFLLALSQKVNYFSLHAYLPPELMSGYIGDVGGVCKFDAR